MSQISETENLLKEKMSFSDYAKPDLKETSKVSTEASRRNQKKNKLTLYLTAEEEALFNEVYIERLKKGKKTDRSTLFSEAVKLLHQQELKQ